MLKRTSFLLSGFVLSFLVFTASVWAGDASLRFQYKQMGANEWSVSVLMENDVTMGGLQFEISYGPEVSTNVSYIDKTGTRSASMDIVQASIPATGKLRVVMLGIGSHVISAGTGSILTIRFDAALLPSLGLSSTFTNKIFDTAGNAAGSIHLLDPVPTVTGVSPNTGSTAGGETVDVNGYYFQNGAEVKFGTRLAEVTSYTATSLTVTTPAHDAGTVSVTVTNPDGGSDRLEDAFTFVVPAPTITGINPSEGSTVGGEPVEVYGVHFQSGATVTFDGTLATVTSYTSDTLEVVTPPYGGAISAGDTVNVDVVVTNPDGRSSGPFSFTYRAPTPTLQIDPTSGPAAGGTSVTISSESVDWALVDSVKFGGVKATLGSLGTNSLSVVTPPHEAGLVDVVVYDADAVRARQDDGFLYIAAPVITKVSPNSGSTAGGTTVTVSGNYFQDGATVKFGDADPIAATFVSPTELTVETPAHEAGIVDVTVTNPDEQSSTLVDAFTYIPPPQITEISPTSGSIWGGTRVTLSGTHFGTTVTFGGIEATVVSGTTTSLEVVTPAYTPGLGSTETRHVVDVMVTNSDGQTDTLENGFTYIFPPNIVSVSPDVGYTGERTEVTLTGAYFDEHVTVSFGGDSAADVAFGNLNTLTAKTPARADTGAVDVVVRSDGLADTLENGYRYVWHPPSITMVHPDSGSTAGGETVGIRGSYFVAGATVSFGDSAAASVTFIRSDTLRVVTPRYPTDGRVDVVVTHLDGKADTLSNGFRFFTPTAPIPPPTVTAVSPDSVSTSGGAVVKVIGSDFLPGVAVKFNTSAATSVTVISSDTLRVVTPAHGVGTVDVVVTNPDSQADTLKNRFRFVYPPPEIFALSPSSGPITGGTVVGIQGANFRTEVVFGGAASDSVVKEGLDSLTVKAPAHEVGTVDVVVRNPDGKADTLYSGFTYRPNITAGPTVADTAEYTATITWTTDVASDSRVEYGTTQSYGASVDSTASVTSHRVQLTNLLAGTTYYYRVRSYADGIASNAATGSFTTKIKPKILTGPFALGITNDRATIQWTTDRPGHSHGQYGTSTSYDSTVDSTRAYKTDHTVDLTGLSGSTTYYYQVWSVDEDGNESDRKTGSFTTEADPDTTKPTILTGPDALGITNTEATVQWTTDEIASSNVEYWKDGSADYHTKVSSDYVTEHSVVLNPSLEGGIIYHYEVWSVDPSGNASVKKEGSFRTEDDPDTTKPTILTGPDASGITDHEATVTWTTDEISTTYIAYGLTTAYGLVDSVDESVLSHDITLTNLLADTTYYYRVRSRDPSGNASAFALGTFDTDASPDTTKPGIIGMPVVTAKDTGAVTMVWRTDEPADSRVEYGETTDYGEQATLASHVEDHSVRLTGLTASTTYYYRVQSVDPSGNASDYATGSFHTEAAPDRVDPVILTGPGVLSKTDDSALIEWTTNELADSRVEVRVHRAAKVVSGSGYDFSIVLPKDVRVHDVTLTGLEPGTTYDYRVGSVDANDNGPAWSEAFSFATYTRADRDNPVFLSGPSVVSKTHNSATIVWRTDEPSDTFVDYGTSLSYGKRKGDAADVEVHSVVLTNLSPNTQYFYRAGSVDPSGNGPTYGTGSFRTKDAPDTDPPIVLTGPMAYWTDTRGTVEWTTNEVSTSTVFYGTVETYGTDEEREVTLTDFVEDHSVPLTGLTRGTRYFYRIQSVDPDGNAVTAGPTLAKPGKRGKILRPPGGAFQFVTLEEPDTRAPQILSGPRVTSKTSTTATIEWTTDERSDSEVWYGAQGQGVGKTAAGVEALPLVEVSAQDMFQHRITLTNLLPGTTYQYVVCSTDPSDNGPVESRLSAVTTDPEQDRTPPKITSGPEMVLKTDRSVVIGWTTDEPSDSRVEYGEDASYGLDRVAPEHVVDHRVTLTNLKPATTYHFRVSSMDLDRNGPTFSGDRTVRTEATSDRTLPTIVEGPTVVSKTDRSATIWWRTDEVADSYVDFGVDASYGFGVGAPEDVVEHTIVLTHLEPSRTYHYKVGSIDRSGNGPTESADFVFQTEAEPDREAPSVPSDLQVRPGSKAVLLSWVPNEEADLVGYHVYRGRGRSYQLIATLVPEPRYLDKGLSNDLEYQYLVTAVDQASNESRAAGPVMALPSAANAPSAPTLVRPEEGATVSLTPMLEVRNAVPSRPEDMLTYAFEVALDRDFEDVVAFIGGVEEGGTTTRWGLDRALEDQRTYWWRARANDGISNGSWTAPASFQTSSSRPERPGDFNSDGKVFTEDFILFVDQFGRMEGDVGFDPMFDLDGDGKIFTGDFTLFVDLFGISYSVGKDIPFASLPPDGERGREGEGVRASVDVAEAGAARAGDEGVRSVSSGAKEIVLDVYVEGGRELKGYGLTVEYDPDALVFLRATPENGLDPCNVLNSAGGTTPLFLVVSDRERMGQIWIANSLAGPQAVKGEGLLAQLRFEVVGALKHSFVARLEEMELFDLDLRRTRVQNLSELSIRVVPGAYRLGPNYPNPFNSSTQFEVELPREEPVEIAVYNVLGQKVRTLVRGHRTAGFYRMSWDGKNEVGKEVASGVYLIRMQTPGFVQCRKLVLLK